MAGTSKSSLFIGISALAFVPSVALAEVNMNEPAETTAQVSETTAAPVPGASDDIVVTARMREESAISAPVVISGAGKLELERRNFVSLDQIAQIVPQVVVAPSGGTTGAIVVIRGVGVGDGNVFAEQAISFNVDGAQISRGSIRRMSELDLAQIEVLKGPQALFFGKNSPAGVIVIRSADPGDRFEARVNGSYEPIANETRGDAFISTPLTDNLGVRLAVFGSNMEGYLKNQAVGSTLIPTSEKRLPKDREYGGRFTLKGDFGAVQARLKLAYAKLMSSSRLQGVQLVDCPTGRGQSGAASEDCKVNNKIVNLAPPAAAQSVSDLFRKKGAFLDAPQFLGSLELNGDLSEALKLTSITSFYKANSTFAGVPSINDFERPENTFSGADKQSQKEYAEELRLISSFSGPLNFSAGLYYQHAELGYDSFSGRGPAVTQLVPRAALYQDGDAYSAFGQLLYSITDQIELSGGGRYSYEKKRFRAFLAGPNGFRYRSDLVEVQNVNPRENWDNFSPEATVAWRPNEDVTVFASYKQGFLSGGYNAGQGIAYTSDRTYNPQITKGVEAGVKMALLDKKLRLDVAAYTYDISNLQVSTIIQISPGVFGTSIVNAGAAKSRGVDLNATYRPAPGLVLRTGIGYNDSSYKTFIAPCWGGQSPARGCNLNPNAAGVFQAQNLGGQPLVRAPRWNINSGAEYEQPIGDGRSLVLSTNVTYSSKYNTQAANKPGGIMNAFALLDAGIVYKNATQGLSVGVLGRNLTNRYVYYRSADTPFTGSGTGTAAAVVADTGAYTSRGREILMRVTINID